MVYPADVLYRRNTGGGGAGGYRTSYDNDADGDVIVKENKLTLSPGINYEVRVGRGGVSDTVAKMNGGDSYISAPKQLGRCKYHDENAEAEDDDEFYGDDCNKTDDCDLTSEGLGGHDAPLLECEHDLNANFRDGNNYVLSKGGGYGGNNRFAVTSPEIPHIKFKNGGDGGSGGGSYYPAWDGIAETYWRDPEPGKGIAGRGIVANEDISNQGFDGFNGFCSFHWTGAGWMPGPDDDGNCWASGAWQSGGGGGAGEGRTADNVSQKDGGNGRPSSITGNLIYRGGGGGAGGPDHVCNCSTPGFACPDTHCETPPAGRTDFAGLGGNGGGGKGSVGGYFNHTPTEGCDIDGAPVLGVDVWPPEPGCAPQKGYDGAFCQGGGGGGSFQHQSGGNGGSGVVIVRYKSDDVEARKYNANNCVSELFSDYPTFWDETTQKCYEVKNKELDVLAKTKVDDCSEKSFTFQTDNQKTPGVACDDYFVLRDIDDDAAPYSCPDEPGRHKSAFLCDVDLESVNMVNDDTVQVGCKNPAYNAKPVCDGCVGFNFENQVFLTNEQNQYTSFNLGALDLT